MTALDEFDRLEALANWQARPNEPVVEVLVTLGEATLTISDLSGEQDKPLTHWSLGALMRTAQDENHTTYGIEGSDETLIVADEMLKTALDRVLPKPMATPVTGHKRPRFFWPAIILILASAAYFGMPDFIDRLAYRMIPPERAALLADEMIPMIEERTGPACASPAGLKALEVLSARLQPASKVKLHVHDLGDASVISLPGDKVVIDQRIMELSSSPEEIAAWAAIGIAGIAQSPAITGLFQNDGLLDGLKFLATGNLPQSAKNRAVNLMLINAAQIAPITAENANQLLINAKISTNGLAGVLSREAFGVEIEHYRPDVTAEPPLTMQEWNSLKGICS